MSDVSSAETVVAVPSKCAVRLDMVMVAAGKNHDAACRAQDAQRETSAGAKHSIDAILGLDKAGPARSGTGGSSTGNNASSRRNNLNQNQQQHREQKQRDSGSRNGSGRSQRAIYGDLGRSLWA